MLHILLIEDNPSNLELMRYLLAAFGHSPLTATDGAQGLALALTRRPALILCDIDLPSMDGYTIARRLKADPELRTTPLIAVTALAMVGDRERILAAGFDGYMAKPIVPEEFIRQIESFLPAAERSIGEPRSAPAAEPTPQGHVDERAPAILVIDDQQVNRDLLHSILEPSGYRVLGAASVAEAIAIARRARPALIVSDLHMPEQTGLDLLRVLKADPELRTIGVIIHSATTQRDADRRQALALGASLFLTGPLDPEEFLRVIGRSLQEAQEHSHGDDLDPR